MCELWNEFTRKCKLLNSYQHALMNKSRILKLPRTEGHAEMLTTISTLTLASSGYADICLCWNPQTAHIISVQAILSKVYLKKKKNQYSPKNSELSIRRSASSRTHSLSFSKPQVSQLTNKELNTWWSLNSSFQGLITFYLHIFIYSLTVSYMYTIYHDPTHPQLPFPLSLAPNLMPRQFSSNHDIVEIINPT